MQIFAFQGTPVREFAYANLYGRDVTAARLAQMALRESEQRLRAILESSPVGVSIHTVGGDFQFCNQQYAAFFGVDKEEIAAIRADNLYAEPGGREALKRRIEEFGSVDGAEVEQRRPDGSIWWSLLHMQKIDYAGEASVISWCYDLTERRELEDAQRRLLESIPVPLVLTRRHSDEILYVKPRRGAGPTGCAGRTRSRSSTPIPSGAAS